VIHCDRLPDLIWLQDKLQSLAGEHTDVLEKLSPNVRKRVGFLTEIQVSTTIFRYHFWIEIFLLISHISNIV
jgi:hypothetical protein